MYFIHMGNFLEVCMIFSKTALDKAITAFEKKFKCNLCMHDYCGQLDHSILPQEHLNRYCTGIKKNHQRIRSRCILFDQTLLQQQEDPQNEQVYPLLHMPSKLTQRQGSTTFSSWFLNFNYSILSQCKYSAIFKYSKLNDNIFLYFLYCETFYTFGVQL